MDRCAKDLNSDQLVQLSLDRPLLSVHILVFVLHTMSARRPIYDIPRIASHALHRMDLFLCAYFYVVVTVLSLYLVLSMHIPSTGPRIVIVIHPSVLSPPPHHSMSPFCIEKQNSDRPCASWLVLRSFLILCIYRFRLFNPFIPLLFQNDSLWYLTCNRHRPPKSAGGHVRCFDWSWVSVFCFAILILCALLELVLQLREGHMCLQRYTYVPV